MAEATSQPSVAATSNEFEVVDAPTPPSIARRLGLGFWLSAGFVTFVVGLAILAPVLPLADPNETAIGGRLEGPRSGLWFGADSTGRDVLSLTIWGSRISLLVGFIAIVIGFGVGGTIGIAAGYFRGAFDKVVSFLFVTLLSFPALILAILITTLLGRTVAWVSVSLGILAIAPVGRLARAQTLVFAEREFVTAAKILGASDRRILVKELLPNVVIPMSALALLGMGIAIVAEGTLAFLAISVEDGQSWGRQIQDAGSSARNLENGPHAALFPIGVLFLTVLSLNYAGDRLREVFDAKELQL